MASSSTELAIFQCVAERGSFAGAAEDVGLSPSAVAKLITRLKQRLGVRLREQDVAQLRVAPSLENQGKIGQIPAMGAKSFSDRRLKLRDPVTRA